MSEKVYNWTDKTSTGLLNDELNHIWQDSILTPRYIEVTLSANQTGNLTAGNHVEFDTTLNTSGHILLSTGAGQADGIFTIPPGVWLIRAQVSATFSGATGNVNLRLIRDPSGAATNLGSGPAQVRPPSSTSNIAAPETTQAVLVNSSTETVELRITASTAINNIQNNSGITIFALA